MENLNELANNLRKVHNVTTNQVGLYKNLEALVCKYTVTNYKRPIANHTAEAFKKAYEFTCNFYKSNKNEQMIVHLDSGCGTGESTIALASQFPEYVIFGVDKSENRIIKANERLQNKTLRNVFFIRAELVDFWRLLYEQNNIQKKLIVKRHTIFYPNPWPKESEAGRRFHLHPVFPILCKLCKNIELRTNWEIYAKEFVEAWHICNKMLNSNSNELSIKLMHPTDNFLTAFERKYALAGQDLWQVKTL